MALLGLSLVIAVAAEVLLRVLDPAGGESVPPVRELLDRQAEAHHSVYVPHADLGALPAPFQEVEVDTPDFRFTFRTDHAGFPNREPWPARADVAVLGNSLITGAGVGYEGQFTTLLQRELGGRAVLNFGLPGGGTEHQLRIYRSLAAPLQPRLVIATLWLTWEIDNSLKFAAWLQQEPRPDFTEYRHAFNSTDEADDKPQPSAVARLRNSLREFVSRSRVLDAVRKRVKLLRGIRDPVERVELDNGEVLYLSARDEKRLMIGWDHPGTPDLKEIFFAPLKTVQAEVEAAGGTFMVVLFPCKEELYAAGEFPELLKPVEDARIELQARGIPTVDLYPAFQATATSRPFFHPIDMHLNAAGHRLVADALARSIAQRDVFTRAPSRPDFLNGP